MCIEASETNDIGPKAKSRQIYSAKHAELQPQATQDEGAVLGVSFVWGSLAKQGLIMHSLSFSEHDKHPGLLELESHVFTVYKDSWACHKTMGGSFILIWLYAQTSNQEIIQL